ncbi:MAG TPA: hypothetical protein VFH63_06150, partial [candidate division Zixibacteria bacterium]|nr:hypothetical protein [candidate division Zixibacteria bacterium]
MSSPPTVDVVLARPSPLAEYAIGVLASAIGFRVRVVDGSSPPAGPCLHYGDAPGSGSHRGCVVVPERPDDRLWEDALGPSSPPVDRRLPFDVVAATAAFLTDAEHRAPAPGATDRHGRLLAAASLQGRAGHATTPIVNRYAAVLEAALAQVG